MGTTRQGKYHTREEQIGEVELRELTVVDAGLEEIEIDGHTFIREDISIKRTVDFHNAKLLKSIEDR